MGKTAFKSTRPVKSTRAGALTALGLLALPVFASAQDTEGEYLGEIQLGVGKREIQTDTATSVTKINQQEIDDRQAGTVAELIDSVPGVTLVNGSTPQGSGINIRGFGATSTFGTDQKVLILVDGATFGSEELYRIGSQLFTDPQLYRSVEVYRGTVGSFQYGSGVVGGMISLETKDASDFTQGATGLRFSQMLQASSNGSGYVTSSIVAWQPTERLEFLFNYTLREQGDQSDASGQTIGNSAFRLPSYLVKARYNFGAGLDHSITASFNSSQSAERDVPYDTFATSQGTFGNVDRDISTEVAGLHYRYQPIDNDLIDLSVNLTYADQSIESTYLVGSCSGFVNCDAAVAPTADADHRYQTTKLTARNSAYFQTGAITHDLIAGVEVIHKKRLDADSAPGGLDKRFAIFAVDEINFGNGFSVRPEFRYEIQNVSGDTAPNNGSYDNDALIGALSLRYEFASGFAVFGSAAYTESLPIIDDLGTPAYMTMPEKARAYEIGMSYSGQDVFAAGDTVSFKANAYRTRIWDITSYRDFMAPKPVGRVDLEGLEMEASYVMASGLYFDLNANVTDNFETTDSGQTRPWRSNTGDSARATVGRRFGDTWDVSWELVAQRGAPDFNGAHVAGYGVNNLRATFRPQSGIWEGVEVRLGVENILNQYYKPNLSTRQAPGRNVKLTVSKVF